MIEKTPQQKYVDAFMQLLEATQEVNNDMSNPFLLDMPIHTGLSEETFITATELNELTRTLEEATEDHMQFAKLWGLGTDVIAMVKAIVK